MEEVRLNVGSGYLVCEAAISVVEAAILCHNNRFHGGIAFINDDQIAILDDVGMWIG